MTDTLRALRLQLEWGADEALGTEPRDRRRTLVESATVLATAPATVVQAAALPVAPPSRSGETFATLDEIEAALRATGGAGLAVTAQHFVRPRGRSDAAVQVIGDCPGEAEERSGVAFSGEAGRLLAIMLESAGIGPDDCAFGYLVPWRPPGGRPASELEVAVCAPFALARLAIARPRAIVPCASAIARTLLGAAAGPRSRGRLLKADILGVGAVPCLAMQPPEQAYASARGKEQAWATMRLLRRELIASEPK